LIEGLYTYSIWASDIASNSITSVPRSFEIVDQTFLSLDIAFEAGWNLVNVPLKNDFMASSLAENISGCLSLSKWDAFNQTYWTYIVGGPPVFDFEIKDGCGYFIDTDQSSVQVFSGPPVGSVDVSLELGWNLIGWYHSDDTSASSLAENISGCLSLSMWDAVNQTYWTYIVGGPPAFDFVVPQGMCQLM